MIVALVNIISWALLIGGGIFVLISTVGMLRFPDFFTRLHAASIADTLGSMLILAGLILQAGFDLISIRLLLIFFFILFTTPTAAHALAKAALHGNLHPENCRDERDQ